MELFPFLRLANIIFHGFSFFHKIGEICLLVEPSVKSDLAKLGRSVWPVVSVSENGKSVNGGDRSVKGNRMFSAKAATGLFFILSDFPTFVHQFFNS